MAGNAGILKHASNVPRTALAIQEVFREAGFPRGLFSTVLISSTAVARLIADPRIVAATLTGSDLAGRKVAEQAGRELKKTVLELGGSDPFVVLADADLAAAARAAADARLVNSGQSCIAAKRFIVVEPVADAFVERFVRELGSRRVGDPLDARPRSGHSRAPISGRRCTARSRNRSSAGRSCSWVARSPTARARSIRRRCSPRSRAACRRSTRRPSGPSPPSSVPRTRRMPFASPTTRPSGSVPRCGRAIVSAPSGSRRRSRPAWSS